MFHLERHSFLRHSLYVGKGCSGNGSSSRSITASFAADRQADADAQWHEQRLLVERIGARVWEDLRAGEAEKGRGGDAREGVGTGRVLIACWTAHLLLPVCNVAKVGLVQGAIPKIGGPNPHLAVRPVAKRIHFVVVVSRKEQIAF